VPETVLKMAVPTCLQTKDAATGDEQMTMFLIRLLLHENFIHNEGYEQERYECL